MKSIYIASSLDNIERVRELQVIAKDLGWHISYDWTKHGRVFEQYELQDCAILEAYGVGNADTLVIILPGGRGTHVELGMAIASGKRIILFMDPSHLKDPCAFYHHPLVTITFSWGELATMLGGES